MLEAGRPVPAWVPPLWRRERSLHWDSLPSLRLPGGKLGFHFLSSCEAAVWRLLHLCRAYRYSFPRRRTPESLLSSTKPTWGAIAPNLLKDLSRGCAGEAASASCTVAWSSAGLSCSVLLPTSFIPFFADISCSWVTCNRGFLFLVHFTAWGSSHRHMSRGKRKEGIP